MSFIGMLVTGGRPLSQSSHTMDKNRRFNSSGTLSCKRTTSKASLTPIPFKPCSHLLLLLREPPVCLLVAQHLAPEPLVLDYLTRVRNFANYRRRRIDNLLLLCLNILHSQALHLRYRFCQRVHQLHRRNLCCRQSRLDR